MEQLCALRIGQEVEELGLRLRLDSVEDDSRCPVGVNCIWAGNVRIILSLSLGELNERRAALNTALEPQAIRARGRLVTIRKVAPPRIAGETIKHDEYLITLAVSSDEGGGADEEEALASG